MAFVGNEIYSCHTSFFKHKEIAIVIVTGVSANLCGHALLNFGGTKGYYVHIDGLNSPPKYMDHFDYERYLRENHKRELYRSKLDVPNPDAAILKLDSLLQKRWLFGFVIHNCASFVEQVVNAGGANFHIQSNCPTNYIPVRTYD